MPKYLLDTNVFIEAARRYYAFDLVPGFWNTLVRLAAEGRVESIDRVRDELLRGDDDLAEWVSNHFSLAFLSTSDESVFEAYRDVITWVENQAQYHDSAKQQFAAGADGWLIAYAKQNGHTVVTQEVSDPQRKNKVPIPNVCHGVRVNFVNTFGMLRELDVRI